MDAGMEGGCGMTFEKLTAEEALQRGLSLPFALIRSVSSVLLGNTGSDRDG